MFPSDTSHSTVSVAIARVEGSSVHAFEDRLAVEEPLEIRLDWDRGQGRTQKSLSITMRTPGHDFELAAGFLFTEGILRDPAHIESIQHCGPALAHLGHSNVVKLRLRAGIDIPLTSLERHFYTTSSCGVCGKASIDALRVQGIQAHFSNLPRLNPELIVSLPARLREAQDIFASTGGLHASALFTAEGERLMTREDVGRHNALDKLIGAAFLKGNTRLENAILMLSGRISFELVQKAAMAGIPVIAAVGAPSSLALELARSMGLTLLGFVRDGRFNVYCGEHRMEGHDVP